MGIALPCNDSGLEIVNMQNGSERTLVVQYLAHQMEEHQRIFFLGYGYNRTSTRVTTSGSQHSNPGHNSLTCFYPAASETWGVNK